MKRLKYFVSLYLLKSVKTILISSSYLLVIEYILPRFWKSILIINPNLGISTPTLSIFVANNTSKSKLVTFYLKVLSFSNFG